MNTPVRMVMSQTTTGGELSTAKILVVGNSASTVELLQSLVLDDGFTVYAGACAGDAGGRSEIAPDLVVMDIETLQPASQVRQQLSAYKSECRAPVLCLLPMSEALNPRDVAELGADDFQMKPVRPIELSSRIRVLLQKWHRPGRAPLIERRRGVRRRADDRPAVLQQAKARLAIDDTKKAVVIDGRRLHLSPKEYDIFQLLASQQGKVYAIEEIIRHVWRDLHRATASDVHQYMHLLRRKVEKDPTRPRWIITVKGFGYKLEVPTKP